MTELPLWAIGVIGAVVFFGLMFLRMHVGLSLMIAGFVGIWLSRGMPAALNTLATTVWRVSNSTYLVVIPLFVLMGIIAGQGGVTNRAFGTFNSWVGHLRGGLAMATVGTCAAFGAVCGDNIATAATMDKAALPEMRKYGYDDRLTFGSIAAGGNLGILIPPSTAFVVFGFITQTSIAALFIAGILPGIILTLAFMVQIAIQCKINPESVVQGAKSQPEGQVQVAHGRHRHPCRVRLRHGRHAGGSLHAHRSGSRGDARGDRRQPLLQAADLEGSGAARWSKRRGYRP